MAASTWQPYSYANDSPVNDNDPTGMDVKLTGGSNSVTGTTPAQAALEVLAAPVSELAHSAPYLGPIIDIAAGVTCVAAPEVCLMTIAANTAFQEFSVAAQKAFTQCCSWNDALAAQMPILVGDALGDLGYMATKLAGDELGTWGKVALGTTVGAPQVIFDGAMIAKTHSATSG